MRRKRFFVLVLLAVVLLIPSCEKDELTLPVKVNFTVGILGKDQLPEYLSFDKGMISISRIAFEGKREVGKDITFETKPGVAMGPYHYGTVDIQSMITHFDIPQGVYYFMDWDVNLTVMDYEYDTYDIDSEDTGLTIEGFYTNLAGAKIPVIIAIDSFEKFEIQATNLLGESRIVITDENEYNATLQLDLSYTFSPITRDSFENAVVEADDDNDEETFQYIEISSDSNQALYEQILFRLQKSAKIVIQ